MKITIISDGPFGDRAVETIRSKFINTSLFIIDEVDRKVIIDEYDFDQVVDSAIKSSDLIISYIRHPDIILELSYYEKPTIIAIFRGLGLLQQIREINENVVMPTSMCSIEPNTGIKAIDEFSKFYGKPKYKLEVDPDKKFISKITLERESPCGSTSRANDFLINKKINKKLMDDLAILIIQDCRESVAYRLAIEENVTNAGANHLFPLIDELKVLIPSLFEDEAPLKDYKEEKMESFNEGKM